MNNSIRITWKDSAPRAKKPVKYRRHIITPYKDGWITDFPEDKNIYASHYCAMNAIDKYLGGTGAKGSPSAKRAHYGIKILHTYK